MSALIECRDLRHSYGEKNVLDGLSFEVQRGGVFGLLGKNGAGKSTTINILMGFLKPTSGSCRVLEQPSHILTPSIRERIGLLHEGFIQYDFMSIVELEKYYASFYSKWDKEVFYELVDRLTVPHSRRLSCMSCGQRSQVVLGLIMAQQPELMILDDYSMGLDVGYRRLFIDFLREYVSQRGTTVLLTSHVVQELDKIVDNMIVLKEGKVAVSGSKKEFMSSFNCYSFERSNASEALLPDSLLQSVEHIGATTTVYAFSGQDEIRNHLKQYDVTPSVLNEVSMDFEDAFIGLTGKY